VNEPLSPDHLAPNDRLCWLIGAACRNDVILETNIRWLFASAVLFVTGEQPTRVPSTFKPLVSATRDAVARLPLDDKSHALAAEVFDSAAAAHAERNRNVHDRWIRNPDVGDEWHRQRALTHGWSAAESSPRTLRDVEECAVELFRAAIRIHGLSGWLWSFMTPTLGDPAIARRLALDDWRTAKGEFNLIEGSGSYLLREGGELPRGHD
jgi:hypothetical protein